MPDGLYERDILVWSEEQANLLRRLAAGERVNGAIDWPNLIEEVEGLGLSELHACQSLIQQAMIHLLKLSAWPESQAAAHWRDETAAFLDDLERRYTPSMRQKLDLDRLYAKALRRVRAIIDPGASPQPPPEACPFTLDALLTADIPALLSAAP